MLAEWYFCCCVDASPANTNIFLHIWDTIHDEESDWSTVSISLEELQKTEVWMQVYLLPDVLATVHWESMPKSTQLLIESYCKNLFEFLPRHLRGPFSSLFDSAYFRYNLDPVDKLLDKLRKCAEAAHGAPGRRVTPTPYLDIKEFIAETMLLAVIADLLRNDPDSATGLSAALNESMELEALLDNALLHGYGRAAFRSAALIAHLSAKFPPKHILAKIRQNRFCIPELEPDLMQTYARVLFADVVDAHDERQARQEMQRLVGESAALEELYGLSPHAGERRDAWSKVLDRLGYDSTEIAPALSVVYWQATLWQLAAEAGGDAASLIVKYWEMPGEVRRGNKLEVYTAAAGEKLDAWLGRLHVLLELRGLRKEIGWHPSKQASVPRHSRWIFFSPWLQLDPRSLETDNKDELRYPAAVNPVALIRLLSAAYVAVELLRKQGAAEADRDKEVRAALAALVAHAASVLSLYGLWLRQHENVSEKLKGKIPELKPSLTGLALFAVDRINLAGRGHYDGIPPTSFLDVLRERRTGVVRPRPSVDEVEFHRSVLPEVLMSWITGAYTGASEGSGAAQWLPLITKVYGYYNKRDTHHDDRSQVEAAAVVHFLAPDPDARRRINYQAFDWRRRSPKQGWKIRSRQLLLFNSLDPEQWVRPYWKPSEDSKWFRDWFPTRLARSIERLAALRDGGAAEHAEEWQNEWIDCMNSVIEKKDLDRFARLRLVELLAMSGLPNELPTKELITLVLLEYGVYYELKNMFDVIFFKDDEGEPTETRKELQKLLAKALYKDIAISSQAQEERVNAGHPRHVQNELTRIDFIKSVLVRLAYVNRADALRRTKGSLGRLLLDLEGESLAGRLKRGGREVKGYLEHSGGGEVIVLPGESPVRPWMIRGMAYDPNTLGVTISADEVDTTGVVNLFEASPDAHRKFRDSAVGETRLVLAGVVRKGPRRNAPSDYVYTFNCGLPFYIADHWAGPPVLREGQRVVLPLWKMQDGEGKTRWAVNRSRLKDVREPRPRLAPSDVVRADIGESRNYGVRSLEITHSQSAGRPVNPEVWDADDWDANFALVFKEPGPRRSVYAHVGPKRRLVPIDLGLMNLLLEDLRYSKGQVAVLNLVRREADTGPGEGSWRFSTLPGRNYLLGRSDFLDADELEQRINSLDDPRGLLVAVTPELDKGVVRLRLWRGPAEDERLRGDYPELSLPFDSRNIDWRSAFKDGENLIATKGRSGWGVSVPRPVPGFPEHLAVEWEENEGPPHYYNRALFAVSGWDPRKDEVTGTYVEIQRLSLREPDYEEFLDFWLHVTKGVHVQLTGVISKVRDDGTVLCRTKEGIAIPVDAESLTMMPLPLNARPSDVIADKRLRAAEVVEAAFREIRLPGPLDLTIEDGGVEGLTEGNRCRGIFIEVPAEPGNTLYEVLWQAGQRAVPRRVRMGLPADLLPRPGTRITGEFDGQRWVWRLDRLYARCRALWRVTQRWKPDGSDVRFLDTVPFGHSDRACAELGPGELAILYGAPEGVPHLAVGDGERFKEGLRRGVTVTRRSTSFYTRFEGDTRVRRVVLALDNNRDGLAGVCRDDDLRQSQLSLNDVKVFLYRRRDDYYSLKREFRVSGVQNVRAHARPAAAPKQEKRWQDILDDYFKLADDSPERKLAAVILVELAKLTEMRVPRDGDWSSEGIDEAVLPAGEGPHMESRHAGYAPRDARVVLFKDDDGRRVYASCRRVPPKNQDAYMSDVGGRFDTFTELKEPLYYVGPEKHDRYTGKEYAEPHHRFEYGPGKMLLAPESRLRFEGGDFKTSELLLNVGDSVTGVTFQRHMGNDGGRGEEVPGEGQPEEEGEVRLQSCVIEINRYNLNTTEPLIRPSQATQLFNQRRDYKIVHILHLRVNLDASEVTIDYIEAFNNKGMDPTAPFKHVKADLTPESKERMLGRLRNRGVDPSAEPVEMVIYGRLSEVLFESSRGGEVIFEHVRMSFEHSGEGSRLRDGEQIFLKAGRIMDDLKNDMALLVGWGGKDDPIIDEEDVGPDFRKYVLLLRRAFSVRENRLQRIYAIEGVNGLRRQKLLVHVEKLGKVVSCSLLKKPPLRTPDILKLMISPQVPLLAVVSEVSPDGVRIELKPGVFTELRAARLESPPKGLEEGAIVQIEAAADKQFRVSRATYGDLRYVPDGYRLGLVLPKNSLWPKGGWRSSNVFRDEFWDNDKDWNRRDKEKKRDYFIVAGLPNLAAQPGSYQGKWRQARGHECVKLMESPHPEKIVVIGKDPEGETRFSPALSTGAVGRLQIAEGSLEVHYAPLEKAQHQADRVRLPWHVLTFGDKSAAETIEHAGREKWTYHDQVTARWRQENGSVLIDEEKTGEHDCWRGPLFFENTGSARRLRYSRDNFLRFGFPVEELILSLLAKKGRRDVYPVAGVPKEGGLWLELAPGRIVELPPQLVVGEARGDAFPLDTLNWAAFALGDLVELELTTSNLLLADRILLRDWSPGARAALGARRSLLPVRGRDPEKGALTLGAAGFSLTVPMSPPLPPWRVVALDPDNRIQDGGNYWPEPGDVVLLGLNEAGEPAVMGFDDITPEPAQKNLSVWRNDPLAEDLLMRQKGEVLYDRQGLRRLIEAVGGALPVTTEFLFRPRPDGRCVLLFSRGRQRAATARLAGRVSQARVLGLHPNGRDALLGCGGDILKMAVRHIVAGLPNSKALIRETALALKVSGTTVYVHGDVDGNVRPGRPVAQRQGESFVTALRLIPGESESEAGLVCRSEGSMRLHWLSAEDAAWTRLSPTQLGRVFSPGGKGYFKARVMDDGRVSIVETDEARKEFDGFKIGKQLVVRVPRSEQDEESDGRKHLVQSWSSNIWLECEAHGDELPSDNTSTMEVSAYSKNPYRLTVVPVGAREYRLDLPAWMAGMFAEPPDARRPAFQNYLLWREEKPEQLGEGKLEQRPPDPRLATDNELNRLLCQMQVYGEGKDSPYGDDFKCQVALAWKSRHEWEDEIDLGYAVTAILLLEKVGLRQRNNLRRAAARELAQNLGGRALRSVHVEVLYRKWLNNDVNRGRDHRILWKRLVQVIDKIKGSPTRDDILAIRQLRRALELRNTSDLSSQHDFKEIKAISDGLSASVGQYPENLFGDEAAADGAGDAWVTKTLIRIYHDLPLGESAESAPLEPSHVEGLERILKAVNQGALDLTLLDNLPSALSRR